MNDTHFSTTGAWTMPMAVGVPASRATAKAVSDCASPWDRASLVRKLYDFPGVFDFFQAVWLLERLYPDSPPVGGDNPPLTEVVRFRAVQDLSFPPSGIANLNPSEGDGPAEMSVAFMGLTGPSGVLPRHYTEQLLRLEREVKNSSRHVLRDWYDIFNHRLISLFYRSWRKYRPAVNFNFGTHGTRQPDCFTNALLSLVGLGMPRLRERLRVYASPRVTDIAAEPRRLAGIQDLSLLRYGGLLAQRPRSASNLAQLLGDYFRLPVKVEQFCGQWLALDAEGQSRLGMSEGNSRLGMDAVAGERVWDIKSKIRVCLGPLSYEQFLEFLPDRRPVPERKLLFVLLHLVRLFVGLELDFDVQLVLPSRQAPKCVLDSDPSRGVHLGWNAWLGEAPEDGDLDDACFEGTPERWMDSST